MSELISNHPLPPLDKRSFVEKASKYGLRTPHLYPDAKKALEALRLGQAVIARSNDVWPGFLSEPSGLADSYIMTPSTVSEAVSRGPFRGIDWEKVASQGSGKDLELFLTQLSDRDQIEKFATLSGIDPSLVTPSFIFQQYIPGQRLTFVADTAIPNRYYLTLMDEKNICHQVRIDNVTDSPVIKHLAGSPMSSDILKHVRGLIDTNTQAEAMLNGNTRHRNMKYIFEFIAGDDGQLYIVQALANQPFQKGLSADLPKEEPLFCKPIFVRGATNGPLKVEVLTFAHFTVGIPSIADCAAIKKTLPQSITGSAILTYSKPVREWLIAKANRCQILASSTGELDAHGTTSLLHKPQVSMVVPTNQWRSFLAAIPKERKHTYPLSIPSWDNEIMDMESVELTITSDGNTAFIT